jgi:hypothetical protein
MASEQEIKARRLRAKALARELGKQHRAIKRERYVRVTKKGAGNLLGIGALIGLGYVIGKIA